MRAMLLPAKRKFRAVVLEDLARRTMCTSEIVERLGGIFEMSFYEIQNELIYLYVLGSVAPEAFAYSQDDVSDGVLVFDESHLHLDTYWSLTDHGYGHRQQPMFPEHCRGCRVARIMRGGNDGPRSRSTVPRRLG